MKMKNKTITTNKGIQILACNSHESGLSVFNNKDKYVEPWIPLYEPFLYLLKRGSHPLLLSMNETAVAIKKIEKKTNHKQRF